MRRLKIAAMLAGTSGLVFATTAFAQSSKDPATGEAPQAPSTEQPVPADPAPQAGPGIADIVVTGSRVIRNGDASPTPVTIISAEQLQTTRPATIAEGLNDLPVFSGSRGQTGNPTNSTGGGNGAANLLNLRNLGANRNLILLDGNRVPPTLTSGSVDVDMMPQMLIKRVDVVTGGVSAVYGSDAVSGVINFITDTAFTGVKAQAYAGVSQQGDAAQQDVAVAFGTGLFGGRGHFEASYEYRSDDGILRRSDRSWNRTWTIAGAGTAASPYVMLPDVRLNTVSFGGLITSGPLAGQHFVQNGVLAPFNKGTVVSACCSTGGDGAYFDSSLKAPLESHQMFARFDYDVAPEVHFHLAGVGNIKRNIQYLIPPRLTNVTLSTANAFIPAAYQSQLAASGSTFRLSELLSYSAPRSAVEAKSRQFMINAGLDGKFGNGWSWNATYIHGWTRQLSVNQATVNNQKLSAALDAVRDPATGNIVCRVELTNPGTNPGCVPLNVFGPTAASAAAIDYILDDPFYVAHTKTDDVEVGISGTLFSLPAGPVDAAISGEWRRIGYYSTSSATPGDLVNCTGLRYNCTVGGALEQTSYAPRTPVSQTVKEAAVELQVPLLKDVPLIRSLSLNGAARYTSYDTSGNYWTWKVGADWQLFDDLRVRATRSRDIRAPTLDDLYAPTSVDLASFQDRLTGQTAPVTRYSGGNPNLTAEIGNTLTLGMVYRPSWLPKVSLAVDYYNIKISNGISTLLGYNAQVQDACYASGGTSPYCALQIRPGSFSDTSPANAVTGWRVTSINLASITTKGVDVELNYRDEIAGMPFSLRALVTHQPHLIFANPGLPPLEHAGVAFATGSLYPTPKWRASLFARIQPLEALTIDVLEKWRSPYTMNDTNVSFVNPKVPSIATTNININYGVKAGGNEFNFFANVQNLFDKDPPPAAFYGFATSPGQFGGWAIGDDPVGRYFTFGVRMKL